MDNDILFNTPNYYAIIPANVRYCKDLTPQEKLLYGEITALSNFKGYCYASNNYFAELYGLSARTISRSISKLADNNFLKVELIYNKNTKEVKERRIYINNSFTPIDKNVHTPIDKNVHTPIDKNVQENNTSINNTSINNNNIGKIREKEEKNIVVVKELIKENLKIELTKKELESILKVYRNIKYLKNKIEITKSQKDIKNIIGFLLEALKNDYKKNSLKKKNDFVNYELSHKYDFEKLERLETELTFEINQKKIE